MRKSRDFRAEAFRPYAIALGELALIWNDLHMALSHLFWAATKIPNGMVPYAMWNSLKSERAQREMLESVANLNVLGHNIANPLRSEITWLLKEILKLEDLRNDALHSPFFDHGNGFVSAWHELGHRRAKKLAGKDILREFERFYDAAIMLREYAMALSAAIGSQDKPLPERPKLPNRGEANSKASVDLPP